MSNQGPLSQQEINDQILSVYPTLERYAKHLIWRHNQHMIEHEDIINMTIERIILKKDKFIRGTKFLSWAVTIMHSQFINYVRQTQNSRHQNGFKIISIDGVEHEAQDALFSSDDPSITLTVRDFIRAFGGLSPSKQEIIMKAYDDKTYDQIAEETGLVVGTVRSRLSRGRQVLRQKMEGKTQ